MHKPLLTLFPLLFLLLAPIAVIAAQPAGQSGDENQAALVIRSGEEQVDTYCVPFAEPEISGYELLQRAGRDVLISDAGLGVTVCRLDQVGCPAGNCFCQCKGDPCIYWSYWHQQEGEWQYAVVGASTYMVQPGEVDGWSWGPGSVSEAIAPPSLSFDDICGTEESTIDATPASPAVAETLPTPAEPVPTLAASPTLGLVSTAVPAGAPNGSTGTASWLYGLFVLIVLGLGAAIWWLQRREGTA